MYFPCGFVFICVMISEYNYDVDFYIFDLVSADQNRISQEVFASRVLQREADFCSTYEA